MKNLLLLFALTAAAPITLTAAEAAAVKPGSVPPDYRLVYEQAFESPKALEDFAMTDPGAWRIADDQTLELARQSRYQPAVRSPVNIALIKNLALESFILEVDLKQTGREYGHRDMCLFFGFQKPANFYYTHIATKADPHAHNIFIVNDQPRTAIARETTAGVNWGLDVWHKVRLERNAADGTVRVFYDDLSKPIMIAEDKTFLEGHVGFGSFDDTGKIDNIRVWAPEVEQRTAPPFKAE